MNLNLIRLLKFVVIFIVAYGLFLFVVPTWGKTIEITVDVNDFTADVSEHSLGIGLNFISDRPNISQPLQKLKVGTLRFATNEYYLFDGAEPSNPKVAIQDPNLWQVKSFAKTDGTWWDKLSFDDFMALCQATNAEPFIVVPIDAIAYRGNARHALPEEVLTSAIEWVQYANLVKKYQVKYWEIGNESNLNHSELINWSPEAYAQTVVQFSQAMKAIDPTIKIGANGMKIDKTQNWWGQIMPIIKDDVDFLVTHQYSWYQDYQSWLNSQSKHDYNLKDAVKAIERYNPSLTLNVTENSSFNPNATHPNNTWKMLHNFEMLGETLSFKKVNYVHFWTSRWLESDPYAVDNSAFDHNYQLTPMGYPIMVWNTFIKQKMVNTSDITNSIRSWVSYDSKDNSLSLFLLNKNQASQKIDINLNGYTNSINGELWSLRGSSSESTNVSWNKLNSVSLRKSHIITPLEPLSVTVISFPGSK